MRRLPVFFVIDVSESMAGGNLRKVESALAAIAAGLRADAHALETVHVSVIAFAGQVRTLVPLIEIAAFYPPKLPVGGGTALGAALEHLMAEIDRQVVKTTPERRGDWRPVIYLLTDGKPTDKVAEPIRRWRDHYAPRATLVAIAIGRFADVQALKQLTDAVLLFEEHREGDFKRFIDWITLSVRSQSQAIGDPAKGGGVSLDKVDQTVLKLIRDATGFQAIDPDHVVLTGRCQRTRQPYLMIYEKETGTDRIQDEAGPLFRIAGCQPLDESYFDWSDATASSATVSTRNLAGAPGCPHCGNPLAFALCVCGRLMCIAGPGPAVCPWCGQTNDFVEGGGHFDVVRGRG